MCNERVLKESSQPESFIDFSKEWSLQGIHHTLQHAIIIRASTNRLDEVRHHHRIDLTDSLAYTAEELEHFRLGSYH